MTSLDEMREFMRAMDRHAWDHTVVCHPEDEARVVATLARMEFVFVRVLTNRFVARGRVVSIDDAKLEQEQAVSARDFWPADQ